MMGWSLPDGPDPYLKLIAAVDAPCVCRAHGRLQRRQLAPSRFYRQRLVHPRVLREAWKVDRFVPREGFLGFIPEMNVHFKGVVPARPDRLRGLPHGTLEAPRWMRR